MIQRTQQLIESTYKRFRSRPDSAFTLSRKGETSGSTDEQPEQHFQGEDVSLPVLPHYRYGKKATWLNFSSLAVLYELEKLGLLDAAGRQMFERFRGTRTLGASLEEISQAVQPYFDANRKLFIADELPLLGKRVLMPTATSVAADVAKRKRARVSHLRRLQKYGFSPEQPPRMLEIGFISGGESLVAFEQLGFEPHGIDYFYGGQFLQAQRWQVVRDLTQTRTNFHLGDITTRTELEPNSFDLIFSEQTIEHIRDLPAAFDEMWRLLRPGGMMLHLYGPYFYPLGGHSFGMLDTPWGHVQLSANEIEDYIKQLRPHEADTCIDWIRSSLNPQHTTRHVQKCLVAAGFAIAEWHQELIDDQEMRQLTSPIVKRAFEKYPGIGLDDLITSDVRFVACKSKLKA